MKPLLCLSLLLLVTCASFAGHGQFNATDRWDGMSLVVCRVLKVSEPAEDAHRQATHMLELRTLMLLSGTLDPAAQRTLTVQLFVHNPKGELAGGKPDAGVSAVFSPPAEGDLVMAVISQGVFASQHYPKVLGMPCIFMPRASGLVVLDGLDDPRIVATLERVKQGRIEGVDVTSHLPDPGGHALFGLPPTTRPSTRPTTRPD